jgi:hypothetical protein
MPACKGRALWRVHNAVSCDFGAARAFTLMGDVGRLPPKIIHHVYLIEHAILFG